MFPIDNPCSLITASVPVMVGRGARSPPARESQAPEGGVDFCPLCVCTCTYVCVCTCMCTYVCTYVCCVRQFRHYTSYIAICMYAAQYVNT